MLDPFAPLQQRLNRAVMARLANASVAPVGPTGSLLALPVSAMFEAEYARADVGFASMASSSPAVTLPTTFVEQEIGDALIQVTQGDVVSCWRVAEHRPDGTGMSTLMLEAAQ